MHQDDGLFEMSELDYYEKNGKTWSFRPKGVLRITNSANTCDRDEILIPEGMVDMSKFEI